MTFSNKKHVQLMQDEAKMFWQISSRAWEVFRENPRDPELDEACDELEVLRDYTDWPLLRQRCVDALALNDKLRPYAKRA
jgi:hypothetical protein